MVNGMSNTITSYIPKNALEYGKNYFKNLRITISLNNMNFVHSNGDKWNCDLSKCLRIAVPKLFKLYQNTIEYRSQGHGNMKILIIKAIFLVKRLARQIKIISNHY